ncbi:MAG: hypothetical protein NY202_01905 [Mollicutes bacterium UO1]
MRHIRQYGKRELNTDNIVDFLKDNLKYSPYHLGNLRNSLVSYASFQKKWSKIE